MAASINITLPEQLKAHVDSEVAQGHFQTADAYIGGLIEDDLLEARLRRALAEEEKAVLVPDDVLESGALVDFVEDHLSRRPA